LKNFSYFDISNENSPMKNELTFSLFSDIFISFFLSEDVEEFDYLIDHIQSFFKVGDIHFMQLNIDNSIKNLIKGIIFDKNSSKPFKLINSLNCDKLKNEDFIVEMDKILEKFFESIFFSDVNYDREICAFTSFNMHVFINGKFLYDFLHSLNNSLIFKIDQQNKSKVAFLLTVLLHELAHYKRLYHSNDLLKFTPPEINAVPQEIKRNSHIIPISAFESNSSYKKGRGESGNYIDSQLYPGILITENISEGMASELLDNSFWNKSKEEKRKILNNSLNCEEDILKKSKKTKKYSKTKLLPQIKKKNISLYQKDTSAKIDDDDHIITEEELKNNIDYLN